MRLSSKTICIRPVTENDAEFIIKLRTDERYNKYLSLVSSDTEKQKEWIRVYKKDEEDGKQFYFIIERLDGTKCGTVRVYDLQHDSFSWGSWILNSEKTRYAALESARLVYQFGFGQLGYNKSHFEVIKGNEAVVKFHKRMGAVKVNETQDADYFVIKESDVNSFFKNLKVEL